MGGVIDRCITSGSLVLSWHINDNVNFLAQFGTFDTIGCVVKDNSIFANLTRNSVENGIQVLESLL